MTATEREVRQCGRTLPHLKHLTLQGRLAYQCPGIELAPLSGEALSEHVRAELDRGVAIFAASEVTSLLAEVNRRDKQQSVLEDELTELREEYANTVARVAELEAERHTTNEALDDTVKAIRDANTAAGLVAEYHVPTTDGWWLAVRREPNGDRWAVYTASRLILGGRQTWTGDHWISIALATDSELWAYDSADAALAEATRLAETTEAVAS